MSPTGLWFIGNAFDVDSNCPIADIKAKDFSSLELVITDKVKPKQA